MSPGQAAARRAICDALEASARLLREAHGLAWEAKLPEGAESDLALTGQAIDQHATRLRRTLRGQHGGARVWVRVAVGAAVVDVRCGAADVLDIVGRVEHARSVLQ